MINHVNHEWRCLICSLPYEESDEYKIIYFDLARFIDAARIALEARPLDNPTLFAAMEPLRYALEKVAKG